MNKFRFNWFAVFMIVLVLCGTIVCLKGKAPVINIQRDPLVQIMKMTQEERMLRNLQDPLALRLYALSQISFASSSKQAEVIKDVVSQWEGELATMREEAYHTSAASLWDLSLLTPEQKTVVQETMAKVPERVPADDDIKKGAAW